MIAALLLTMLVEATPAPQPSIVATQCGATISSVLLRQKKINPMSIRGAAVDDYGLAGFSMVNATFKSSAWFMRRSNVWCLIGYGTGPIGPDSGIRLGVPRDAATRVFATYMQLNKDDD